MAHLTIPGILLSALIGASAGILLGCRIASRAAARRARLASQRAADLTDGVRIDLEGLVETLTAQLRLTTAERNDWERRTEENRKAIEAVIKERDGWCRLYDQQWIGDA